MKRTLALALAILLALGAASMTANAEADKVNLVYYYAGNGQQQDTQLVNDAVNAKLAETAGMEHVSVTLKPEIGGEYNQKLTLALTAGVQIDIVSLYKAHNNYYDEFINGTYICLDDYMSLIPDTVEALPEWIMGYGKMDGRQYYIPTYQQNAIMFNLYIPTEYLPYIADGSKDTARRILSSGTYEEKFDMLTDYVLAVRAAFPDRNSYAGSFVSLVEQQGLGRAFDVVYTSMPRPVEIDSETHEVKEFYSTDLCRLAVQKTAENYAAGLIPEDILTTTDGYSMKDGGLNNAVIFEWGQGVGDEATLEGLATSAYGCDMTVINSSDFYFLGMNYAAAGNAVTVTCEHPEEAVRFIDLLCTPKGKEVYNTLVYGIEGTHYEKIDDNHIRTFEYDGTQGGASTTYAAWKWNIGNTFNAYLNQGCAEGTNEYILDVMHGSMAKPSDLIGMVWDTTPVESELAQMMAVQKEYYEGLKSGVKGADWEAYFNEYVAKLESAGVADVVACLQGQVDEFLGR